MTATKTTRDTLRALQLETQAALALVNIDAELEWTDRRDTVESLMLVRELLTDAAARLERVPA